MKMKVSLHSLPLMNSFNKTEAAVFSCRLCFLRASPFISLVLHCLCYVKNKDLFVIKYNTASVRCFGSMNCFYYCGCQCQCAFFERKCSVIVDGFNDSFTATLIQNFSAEVIPHFFFRGFNTPLSSLYLLTCLKISSCFFRRRRFLLLAAFSG